MRLRTWCGSYIETEDRHWSVWFRWSLGWLRHLRSTVFKVMILRPTHKMVKRFVARMLKTTPQQLELAVEEAGFTDADYEYVSGREWIAMLLSQGCNLKTLDLDWFRSAVRMLKTKVEWRKAQCDDAT
jgi:hypothetical protein